MLGVGIGIGVNRFMAGGGIPFEDDLALNYTGRDAGSLTEYSGLDATILTPVVSVDASTKFSAVNTDFIFTTESFALEFYLRCDSGNVMFRNGGGFHTAIPGYSVTTSNLQIASGTSILYNADHSLNFVDGEWHHLFVVVDRSGYIKGYRDGVLVLNSDISSKSSESITTTATIMSFSLVGTDFVGDVSYIRIYKFSGVIPDITTTIINSNRTTRRVNEILVDSIIGEWNFNEDRPFTNSTKDNTSFFTRSAGTTPISYSEHGSIYNLDHGCSLYQADSVDDKYISLLRDGSLGVLSVPETDLNYVLVRTLSGALTTVNNSHVIIGFNETESADSKLEIFDRLNATRQSALSRASSYYDATSLATRSRYHISEIADPRIYRAYFNDTYRGLVYPQVTTVLRDYPIDITLLSQFLVYTTDKQLANDWSVWKYCTMTALAESPSPVYDAEDYVTVLAAYSVTKIPMVVFVDDDGTADLYDQLYPVFQAQGEVFTAALVSEWVRDENPYGDSVTPAEIITMQTAGHEIASHSKTHPHVVDLTTEALYREQLEDSKAYLESIGCNIYNYVYPFYEIGDYPDYLFDSYEAAAASGGVGELPEKLSEIQRASFDDPTLIGDLEAYVDEVETAAGDKVLVLTSHSQRFDATEITKLNAIIDYIQAKGIAIVTLKQAIEKIKSYNPQDYHNE